MKTIKLKMSARVDRERIVVALANSGYPVKVVEKQSPNEATGEFFVYFEIADSEVLKSKNFT